MADADERAPLLGNGGAAASTATRAPSTPSPPTRPIPAFRITQRQKAVACVFVAIFLIELSVNSCMPAVNSMMETILCRNQYGDAIFNDRTPISLRHFSSDDPRCKAPEIQERLASLRGWMTALDCIPSILFSIPYGILADSLGRRPVILLAWLGVVLQLGWYLVAFGGAALQILPLSSVCFTAVLGCIGSFASVGPAMVYTVLADVTPQAERANVYFRVSAVFLMAELISNPLGGLLLMWGGDRLAMLFGFFGAVLSGLVLLALLPETLNFNHAAGRVLTANERRQLLLGQGHANAQVATAATPHDADAGTVLAAQPVKPRSVWQQFVHLLCNDARATSVFMLQNRPLMLLMMPFCLILLGRFVQDLLLQYATKRFGWSWSQAAFLLTIRSTANLVLTLAVLPFISEVVIVRRWGVAPLRKDLWLARVSGALLCLGALLIAFAVTPWLLSVALVVFSLGAGYAAVMRSLLNAFVEPHHQAMLNSLLGLLEFSGLMVAAPVMYGALRRGLALGGLWIGLPFMIAACMFFTATIVVCIFRIPPALLRKQDGQEVGAASMPGDDEEGAS